MRRILLMSQRLSYLDNRGLYDSLEHRYVKFWSLRGWTIVPLPNGLPETLSWIRAIEPNAFVLTGGGDVDPGFIPDRTQEGTREHAESIAFDYSLHKGLPILGICRGMQMINAYFGGKLRCDLSKTELHPPPGHVHPLTVTGVLRDFLKHVDTCNSFHDHGLTRSELSSVLSPFALADQIVEGCFHPDLPVAGIQWHPERESAPTELDKVLLDGFDNGELFWKRK